MAFGAALETVDDWPQEGSMGREVMRGILFPCVISLVIVLVACTPAGPPVTTPSPPPSPSPTITTTETLLPSTAVGFPTAAFAAVSDGPVAADMAAKLQATLTDLADGAGVSATIMSTEGTWSGATGKADGFRDVSVDDQFAIASITKSVVAAQVMQLIEAGDLALDDAAADHLPPDLAFDANGATIRQLLGHRGGLPGYDPALFDPGTQESPSSDRRRAWTLREMLAMVLPDRRPAGASFEYTNTDYLVLGLVIEHVRGRPISQVLRQGVLGIDGVGRLIYQPGEMPTAPMAMPFGGSTDTLEEGGGFLPSLAAASSDGPAASMASDSPSLAHWWRAFCAGEIVSQASLTEMTTMHDEYGLGLYNPDPPGTVGHGGTHIGYTSLAGCLPSRGAVVAVLSNSDLDVSAVAGPLLDAMG
jgi:D-alanyl-D-alanine carboxypeptidase